MACGVGEGVGPSELGEEEPGTACSGRREGRECRARGEGERKRKKKKKRKRRKNRKKKKRKEGRENKEREGERFAPVTRRLVGHARRRARVGQG